MAGRPPKSVAQLKLEGTYRADRHKNREFDLKPLKNVDCPADIKGEARSVWSAIVPTLCALNLVKIIDLPTLKDAFKCYEIAQELYSAVEARGGAAEYLAEWEPGEKDLLFEARRYMDEYEKIMWKFGVTPSEAARVGGAVKKDDEEDDSAIRKIIGNG